MMGWIGGQNEQTAGACLYTTVFSEAIPAAFNLPGPSHQAIAR
jgi:hypothetical protein